MTFHQPSIWFLLLLVLVPLLIWQRFYRRRNAAAVGYSSVEPLLMAGSTWAVRFRWLIPALRTAALLTLIICVARPQKPDEQMRIFTEGIAIELVIDRSGSMVAMDFMIGRERVTRLEAVKDVVERFVTGGGPLQGRLNDLIGVIAFGTYADSICPLTLDHDHVVESIRQVSVSPIEAEQATAIGDAIGLAVERLHGLGERDNPDAAYQIKSKVIILLTDGENNIGDLDPLVAAEMAAAFDIRIYTIAAGTEQGVATLNRVDPRTGLVVPVRQRVSIDEETLQAIASETGGKFFRARDAESLQEIYATIDELERSEIEQRRFTDYHEVAVNPLRVGEVYIPPLLLLAVVFLMLELLLQSTRFRQLP